MLRAVVLVVATVAAYLPALRGGFIWNDSDYVTAPALQSWAGLARIWFEVGATEQYYPLLHSAFWLEHRLWGDAPLGYHLVNVVLHAANALLFVRILRQLRVPGAWLAGFCFALHPVCVESVAWIAEQKNTLSLFFYLLAGAVYLRFRATGARRDYLHASGWFLAALLTKSLTATLPGALLVLAWWKGGWPDVRRQVRPLLPWLAAGAAAGLFTGWVERTVLQADGADFALGPLERVLLAARACWFYLGKLVWPADLVFIYPRWTISATQPADYVPLGALLLALAGLAFAARRNRGAIVPLLLFLGGLFPTSGLFNLYGFLFSYVADHWQYLPSLAGFAVGGLLVARLGAGSKILRVSSSLAGAGLVLTLGVLTYEQSALYHDIESFFEQTLALNPECWMAHNNLGTLLAGRREWVPAIAHYEAGLRLKPDRFELHNNLALAWVSTGHWTEAAEHYREAIAHNPRSFASYDGLGTLLRLQGRPEEALALHRRALELRPSYALANMNLGLDLLALRRDGDAAEVFAALVKAEPGQAEAYTHLGVALARLGRLDEARASYERALTLQPGLASAHDNLGNLLRRQGQTDAAILCYQRALQFAPGSAGTLVNLTSGLCEAGRYPEAVATGLRAVELAPAVAEAHFNLALALFGEGRLPDARGEYREARRLNPSLPVVPPME